VTGEWIGFAAVVAPAILLGVFFWLRFRARREMQDTIRIALDKGHELSPELIDRLGHPKAVIGMAYLILNKFAKRDD